MLSQRLPIIQTLLTGVSSNNIFTINTPAGIDIKLKITNNINPKLYFSYVKSKFTHVEEAELKRNLTKLKKLIAVSSETGQQAYYEALCVELVKVVREQEIFALGYYKKINISSIDKFRYQVKDNCIKFDMLNIDMLKNFPRVIPKRVRSVIKKLKDYKVFDELHILYIDYTEEILKTNKEKIREKDPILFGKFSFDPNTLYYITDWVDKYCDLTLVKLVDTLKITDSEFELDSIPEIDDKYVKKILQEVDDRVKRLSITTPSNFRNLMAEEDKVEIEKVGFFRNILAFIGKLFFIPIGGPKGGR